jgi:peptidoglycan/LPS O-acetylase OafA/YrhL
MKSLNLAYNPRIDQLRWVAATVVFLYHFHLQYRGLGGVGLSSPWLALITEGHTGVGLFFTLSGFLFMQIALFQKEFNYREFLRNRCLRILPLFLAIFVLATSIGRDKFAPADLLYVFSTNLGLAPTSYTPVTGAAWSISIEFMFYLVFPFLARFTLEQGPRYLLKLLALMVFFKLAAYSVNEHSTLMYFSTLLGRFDQFLVGMLAALVVRRYAAPLRRHALWLLPPAVLLVVLACGSQSRYGLFIPETHNPFWIFWSLIESFSWACVIMVWVSVGKILPAWLENLLSRGGKISFSFYLLHMAVIHTLSSWFGMPLITGHRALDILIALVICYGLTWLLSSISYSTIEEPFLRLRHGYGAVKVAAVAVADGELPAANKQAGRF